MEGGLGPSPAEIPPLNGFNSLTPDDDGWMTNPKKNISEAQTTHELTGHGHHLTQRIPASKQADSEFLFQWLRICCTGPTAAACALESPAHQPPGPDPPLVHTPRPRCSFPSLPRHLEVRNPTPLPSLCCLTASASPPRLHPINDATSQTRSPEQNALESNPAGKPPACLVPFPHTLESLTPRVPALPRPRGSVPPLVSPRRGDPPGAAWSSRGDRASPRLAFGRGQCGYHFTRRPSVGSLGGTRRV